jgi:hypothetical protein
MKPFTEFETTEKTLMVVDALNLAINIAELEILQRTTYALLKA